MQSKDQQLIEHLAAAIHQSAQAQGWTAYIPAVSTMIAAISALLSILFFIRSQKNTRVLATESRGWNLLPVIVFYRRPDGVWTLKNIGEGTAVRLVVRNFSQLARCGMKWLSIPSHPAKRYGSTISKDRR